MKTLSRLSAFFLTLSLMAFSIIPTASADEMSWPRSYDHLADNSVLVFSATGDWRHDSGIAGAAAFWARESDSNGTGIFTTENPAVFSKPNLEKFSVIVLNSMTGDVLSAAQKSALAEFVEGGGGLIIHHGGGDGSSGEDWPWYKDLIGTVFVSHPMDPQLQEASVVTLAPDHPVMAGLEDEFSQMDEWYSFDGPVTGKVTVLAGLDESSYSPVNNVYGEISDLRMGPEASDHPIIWAKCPGSGRMVYSALGHNIASFDNEAHQELLRNAMAWVRKESDTGGEFCPK